MKGAECFVSLQTIVVVTEECNVMVNSDELIRATEYLKLLLYCTLFLQTYKDSIENL
jgi:hypothetical protein